MVWAMASLELGLGLVEGEVDGELKAVGCGEGLGKGWAPAKDSESFRILGKETSWIGV